MPRVVVYKRSAPHLDCWFDGRPIIVIGRAPTNDIVLQDSSLEVSRYHAALVPGARKPDALDRYFIRDLGSLHSTRVAGEVVHRRWLRDGDSIEIGVYRLEFSGGPGSPTQPGLIEVVDKKRAVVPDMPTRPSRPIDHLVNKALTPDRSELLHDLYKKRSTGLDLKTLLAESAALVFDVMRADRGFVCLFHDPGGISSESVAAVGMKKGVAIQVAVPQFMQTLLAGRCVQDVTTLLVPVVSEGRPAGFWCLDRQGTSLPFVEHDGEFLLALGRQLTAISAKGATGGLAPAPPAEFRWEEQLVGKSPQVESLLVSLSEAALGDESILLIGETGTGKELAAGEIRTRSMYAKGPFIAKFCGQATESISETDLFGYAPKSPLANADPAGAPGWFEMADGGTLFLDEIQSLSPSMQEKFLRVLQQKEIWRYGAKQPTKVDVKVIAATSLVDLERAVEEGRFLEALYHRFSRLRLPTLRSRPDDIPLLAFYFLDFYAAKYGSRTRTISRRALQMITRHSWKGNVRELQGQIRDAVARNREVLFSWDFDIPADLSVTPTPLPADPPTVVHPPMTMRESEREMILAALIAKKGNITQACRLLGYGSRTTMLNKMDGFGIPRKRPAPDVISRRRTPR